MGLIGHTVRRTLYFVLIRRTSTQWGEWISKRTGRLGPAVIGMAEKVNDR